MFEQTGGLSAGTSRPALHRPADVGAVTVRGGGPGERLGPVESGEHSSCWGGTGPLTGAGVEVRDLVPPTFSEDRERPGVWWRGGGQPGEVTRTVAPAHVQLGRLQVQPLLRHELHPLVHALHALQMYVVRGMSVSWQAQPAGPARRVTAAQCRSWETSSSTASAAPPPCHCPA